MQVAALTRSFADDYVTACRGSPWTLMRLLTLLSLSARVLVGKGISGAAAW